MRKIATLGLALAMAALSASDALADDKPGPGWMPQDQVAQKLAAAGYSYITGLRADEGYSYITGLEADDSCWEGEAVHNGHLVEFRADPKTGAILSEKPGD